MEQVPEQRSPQRFWLEYQGRKFDLRSGQVLIGRSSNCHLVLDDALVSRRHAQFVVTDEHLIVEDFASANGVFVNDKRVVGSEPLAAGDQLQIGGQQFAVCAIARGQLIAPSERLMAETLHGFSAAPGAPLQATNPSLHAKSKSSVPDADAEATHRAEALELLGGVADKVLAMGRGEEAERVLANALASVLNGVKHGAEPTPRAVALAGSYAGKLAEATLRGKWLDYTFELYAELRRPLPIELVDQMYAVLRRVDGVNLTALRAYLSVLQAQASTYGPNERFAIQRLEGFERLAALK